MHVQLTEFERQIENEIMDSLQMMNARYPGYGLAALRWDDEQNPKANGRQRIGWTIIESQRGLGRVSVLWDRESQQLQFGWLNVDMMIERSVIEFDELMMQLDMEFEARWWDEYRTA